MLCNRLVVLLYNIKTPLLFFIGLVQNRAFAGVSVALGTKAGRTYSDDIVPLIVL
jgi:hypothetical protein